MKNIEVFNRDLNQSLSRDLKQMNAFKLQVDLIIKSVFERLQGSEKAIIIGSGKITGAVSTTWVSSYIWHRCC